MQPTLRRSFRPAVLSLVLLSGCGDAVEELYGRHETSVSVCDFDLAGDREVTNPDGQIWIRSADREGCDFMVNPPDLGCAVCAVVTSRDGGIVAELRDDDCPWVNGFITGGPSFGVEGGPLTGALVYDAETRVVEVTYQYAGTASLGLMDVGSGSVDCRHVGTVE